MTILKEQDTTSIDTSFSLSRMNGVIMLGISVSSYRRRIRDLVDDNMITFLGPREASYCKYANHYTMSNQQVIRAYNYLRRKYGLTLSLEEFLDLNYKVFKEVTPLARERASRVHEKRISSLEDIKARKSLNQDGIKAIDNEINLLENKIKRAKRLIKKEEAQAIEAREQAKTFKAFCELKDTIDFYGQENRYLDDGSLRLWSSACNTKNPENHPDDHAREEFLKQVFGDSEIASYDLKSSIYNVTRFLNTGELYTTDFYADVFTSFLKHLEDSGYQVNQLADFTKIRGYFKRILMPCYMNKNSDQYRSNKFYYYFEKVLRGSKFFKKYDEEIFELYDPILKETLIDFKIEDLYSLKNVLKVLRIALYETLQGPSFEASIFYHESNIHLIVLKLIQSDGIKVLNVYDNFYTEKSKVSLEDFENYYRRAAMFYYQFLKTGCLSVSQNPFAHYYVESAISEEPEGFRVVEYFESMKDLWV